MHYIVDRRCLWTRHQCFMRWDVSEWDADFCLKTSDWIADWLMGYSLTWWLYVGFFDDVNDSQRWTDDLLTNQNKDLDRWLTDPLMGSQGYKQKPNSPTWSHHRIAMRSQRVYSWPQADLVAFGCMGEWIWELYFLKYGCQIGPLGLYLVGRCMTKLITCSSEK